MSVSRIDLHPLGGVAGDMFAAAVFDAYPDLYPLFLTDLSNLQVEGLTATLVRRMTKGFDGGHFDVVQATDLKPPRTLGAVQNFLTSSLIDSQVVKVAIGIYSLLAKAEAAVHGKSVDTIHFHEVSDWDSMVDIVAAAGVITRLDCQSWRLSPLPLGGGTINTAHGDIPLPAPATLQLLHGYEWIDDGVPGERVTPTGAAIVAYLEPSSISANVAAAKLSAVGVGCGTRELADRANILRLTAFEEARHQTIENDVLCRLAFEVDDMTGEEMALATDALRDVADVVDVSSVAMHGKKGRHCVGIRVLGLPAARAQLTEQCFLLYSTLGIRHSMVERSTLQRQSQTTDGVRVKIASRPQGVVTTKAESDDLASQSKLADRRQLAARSEQLVLNGNKKVDDEGTEKP